MERIDQCGIDLEQRLAAGEHHVTVVGRGCPLRGDGAGEFRGRGVAPAQRAVGADEVRVAEFAGGARAVGLSPAPEVAAGKTAKYGRAPGMCAFALQSQEDFLDRVTQPSLLNPVGPSIL
ncbi:hypothetical protein ACVWWP_006862 [Bradyrhizobium sp. LM3.6]